MRGLNLAIIFIGIVLTLIFWYSAKPYFALTTFLLTVLMFSIRAYFNIQKLNTDPELKKQHESKKIKLQKQWGILDYLHTTGVEGNAEIKKLVNVKAYEEVAVTDMTFQLEITDNHLQPIHIEIKREIPNPLVPLFILGQIFTIKYDPEKPENVLFIGTGWNGQQINLKEVYNFN